MSRGIADFFREWPELAFSEIGQTVPAAVTAFVRALLAEPRDVSVRTGLMRPSLAVDVVVSEGAWPPIVAAFHRFRIRDPVRQAAKRFRLTDRERQVLALVLTGMGAAQVAQRLGLSEPTIHDYFRRLRQKTDARNLSGMIATLLGWGTDAPLLLGFVDAEDAR